MNTTANNYISYEYKEIVADSSKASFLLDGYECFGWEQDHNLDGVSRQVQMPHSSKVTLRLKRNRKITNKMELTRLQRHFEACVREIEMLQRSRVSKATMWSLIIGIIGTAFMAGAVFAIVAPQPKIILSIILAIPAFIGWILPYFVFKKTAVKEAEKMDVLIEEKYDEIHEICEKGQRYL